MRYLSSTCLSECVKTPKFLMAMQDSSLMTSLWGRKAKKEHPNWINCFKRGDALDDLETKGSQTVYCSKSCNRYGGSSYGDGKLFSIDSKVCASAIVAGKITDKGGEVISLRFSRAVVTSKVQILPKPNRSRCISAKKSPTLQNLLGQKLLSSTRTAKNAQCTDTPRVRRTAARESAS